MGWKQEMFPRSWSEKYSTSSFQVRLSWKQRFKTLIPRKLENKDPQFFLLEKTSTNGCVTYLKHNSSPLFTPRCLKVKAKSPFIFKWVTMLHVWLEECQWTVFSTLFLMKSFVACTGISQHSRKWLCYCVLFWPLNDPGLQRSLGFRPSGWPLLLWLAYKSRSIFVSNSEDSKGCLRLCKFGI